jgi:hypothetical protein
LEKIATVNYAFKEKGHSLLAEHFSENASKCHIFANNWSKTAIQRLTVHEFFLSF